MIKFVDPPLTMVAAQRTARHDIDRIADLVSLHGARGVSDVVACTQQLQHLEIGGPGLARKRYEPVQVTGYAVLEHGVENVKCLGRYQLAVFMHSGDAPRPER